MNLRPAHTNEHLAAVRSLFSEYANSLDLDLCFQNFNQELAELPGMYAPPQGRLFLAMETTVAAGCVGLRKLTDDICEMKRLYVQPAFRGQGVGRLLAQSTIQAARECGYKRMRLDTLSSMLPAIDLYQSMGFRPIAPYYDNPSDRAVFMELILT